MSSVHTGDCNGMVVTTRTRNKAVIVAEVVVAMAMARFGKTMK